MSITLAICLSITLVGALLATSNTGGPVVTLGYGSFQGNATGALVEFLGMPYAAPPYASFSFDDILINTSFKAFDLLPLHCLWNLLESVRLLVLDPRTNHFISAASSSNIDFWNIGYPSSLYLNHQYPYPGHLTPSPATLSLRCPTHMPMSGKELTT
jgi:hypothetical protein